MMVQGGRLWQERLVEAHQVVQRIKPGTTVWIGSGLAEPDRLIRTLLACEPLQGLDAEMVQPIAGGPALAAALAGTNPLRFKTFSICAADAAAKAGRIDWIPILLAAVPSLIHEGRVGVDMLMVRVSPPDDQGFCCLGPCPDISLAAMERAAIVVGEITPDLPAVAGSARVDAARFTHFVVADRPIVPVARPLSGMIEKAVAGHVASLIENGATLCVFPGPLLEAMVPVLAGKKDLNLWAVLFTDALMDLIVGGACAAGCVQAGDAAGSADLMTWLSANAAVEFVAAYHFFNPVRMGCRHRVVLVVPAAAVDLGGHFVADAGAGSYRISAGQVEPLVFGARMAVGGLVVAALASRSADGGPGVRLSLGKPPVGPADIVVTEQGVARLRGLSLRERAQALIDIAHPQDRAALVEAAKVAAILYSDQIFLSECALDHSAAITADATFKAGLRVRFRPIRPSDEEGMRRLFYRFSKEAVYYRYFAPVAAMPHEKMQAYVNTDCTATLSIVGLVETVDGQTIVAEARYVAEPDRPWAEVAFIVDEALQGRGIGTFVYRLLADAARQRGIKGFTASVLATNKAMLSVFEKGGLAFNARLNGGIYDLTIPL